MQARYRLESKADEGCFTVVLGNKLDIGFLLFFFRSVKARFKQKDAPTLY